MTKDWECEPRPPSPSKTTIKLPEGEIADFVPCVYENIALQFTEMALKDCHVTWTQLDEGPHHVDLGYDNEGNLVGIKIWRLVARRRE